ncbi:LysR family transcriptional regulator [Brucella pseudogrignonensis]|uniref:LysR family transcriptional regulator n=1 Tax=Brucella pseudogrignonensis TaxID=419475 RepID=UPI0028B894C5|nr:LysR family transcriptional regulator [Brucella pseudogrignonensis]MDT6939217.1 LysR family transcriptional regulator [Brucella pseudogrignonensis]
MRQFAWDDLQYFLAVARTGQLSAAARQLRTSHVTVLRRIDRLEQSLATKLFERNPRGYLLTPMGERFVEPAEVMEREALKFQTEATGSFSALSGVVRLSTLEGFGNFFLADRLPVLAQSYPSLSVEVVTIQQIMSLSRREAELSITLHMPRTGPYHSERITPYRLFIYGHRDYLNCHPPIRAREDLTRHPFIGYIDDMVFTPGLDYMREILPGQRCNYQSSSIHAQLTATLTGYGLCVLPYFIACQYPDLMPVLPKELHLEREYWMNCHVDVMAAPRIRVISDFMLGAVREASANFIGESLL